MSPCDAKQMLETKMAEPDLVLEGSHLGRGCKYFDEEVRLRKLDSDSAYFGMKFVILVEYVTTLSFCFGIIA